MMDYKKQGISYLCYLDLYLNLKIFNLACRTPFLYYISASVALTHDKGVPLGAFLLSQLALSLLVFLESS